MSIRLGSPLFLGLRTGIVVSVTILSLLVALTSLFLPFYRVWKSTKDLPTSKPAIPTTSGPTVTTMSAAATAISALECLTLDALKTHTATVIFVHGLGDSGHGWASAARMFQFDDDPLMQSVKWILPHAPLRRVTGNGGAAMPAWFDVKAFGGGKPAPGTEDEEGMLHTVANLTRLIETEVTQHGIPANKIILGGFSQGCVMSLLTGLTMERQLAGVIALSGRVPMQEKFQGMLSPHATSLPIFWGHGSTDPIVRLERAEESVELLKKLGIRLRSDNDENSQGLLFNVYKGLGHSTAEKELEDLKVWMKSVLSAGGAPKSSAL